MKKYKILSCVLIIVFCTICGFKVYTPNQSDTSTPILDNKRFKLYVSENGTEYMSVFTEDGKLIKLKPLNPPLSSFMDIPFKREVKEPMFIEPVKTPVPKSTPKPNTQSNISGNLIGGDFTLTHYCHCSKCCGTAGQPTASGRMPEVGITVGVHPKYIKLGSHLRIEIPDGNGGYKVYRAKARADDTGSAVKGHKIDIFVGSHEEALSLGVIKNARVYLIGD